MNEISNNVNQVDDATSHAAMPGHVGIIMDGNGRWAELRGLSRIEGHKQGVKRVREIIDASLHIGLKALTLYVFSMENWRRPSNEVKALMGLFEFYLKREVERLVRDNIIFRAVGDIERLEPSIHRLIDYTIKSTEKNSGMFLTIAMSYGGRDEILRAVRRMLKERIEPEGIDEAVFNRYLDTAGLPEPDLIIRTSGVMRLSNFLLWQSAYSELYFTDTLWPDFGREEFLKAIRDYQGRERKFGALPANGVPGIENLLGAKRD